MNFYYPSNMEAKATLGAWTYTILIIHGALILFSVFFLVKTMLALPLILSAFPLLTSIASLVLSARVDGISMYGFLGNCARYLLFEQLVYFWELPEEGGRS